MKKLRRFFIVFAQVVGAVVVCLGLLLLLASIRSSQGPSRVLSDALSGARSVSVVEFVRYYYNPDTGEMINREVVLRRVTLGDAQINGLRQATAPSFAFASPFVTSVAACFTPHHQVEVVRSDGSTFRFEVCFHCRNYRFDKSNEEALPDAWTPRLRQFFTDLDMPPRTSETYQRLAEEKVKG